MRRQKYYPAWLTAHIDTAIQNVINFANLKHGTLEDDQTFCEWNWSHCNRQIMVNFEPAVVRCAESLTTVKSASKYARWQRMLQLNCRMKASNIKRYLRFLTNDGWRKMNRNRSEVYEPVRKDRTMAEEETTKRRSDF